MALPIPNVPYADGVPQLPRLPGAIPAPIPLLASEAISALLWQASQSQPLWGVFDAQGNVVLDPDSVLEFAHRRAFEVSNFPVQAGSFASYNKVILPFEVHLRVSKGGDETERQQLLADIEALAASTALYTVVTPERRYQNCNLDRYEVIRRGARGAYFLTEVDLYFIQIIEVAPQYTTTAVQLPNAQSPAAQPVANNGTVQAQTPSSAVNALGQAATASASPNDF